MHLAASLCMVPTVVDAFEKLQALYETDFATPASIYLAAETPSFAQDMLALRREGVEKGCRMKPRTPAKQMIRFEE